MIIHKQSRIRGKTLKRNIRKYSSLTHIVIFAHFLKFMITLKRWVADLIITITHWFCLTDANGVNAVKIAFSINQPLSDYETAEYEVYFTQRKGT